jgi:hypothetical protein
LMLTAFVATFTTYSFLERQEHENFVTAVRKGLCFNSNACVHHKLYHPINSFATYLMLPLIQMTLWLSNSIILHNSPERFGENAVNQQ